VDVCSRPSHSTIDGNPTVGCNVGCVRTIGQRFTLCDYLLNNAPRTSSQTGRIGSEAPAEYIIASIVAVLGSYTLSLTTPFLHRFGPSAMRKAVILLVLGVGLAMAVFARKDVFDRNHQKRLFVLHKEDVSTVSRIDCKED
jgi:hypothetical protein